MKRILIHVCGLTVTWLSWFWLSANNLELSWQWVIAVGGVLLLLPILYLARKILDQQPTLARAEQTTVVVHYLIAILMGSAAIAAVQASTKSPGWLVPLPPWIGIGLMGISGCIILAVVVSLAIRGLAAPFAIAQTRTLVSDLFYAWTRNPMVLSALAFLVGVGLWLRSGVLIAWLLVVLSPAVLAFLQIYEERELEIRFGEEYRAYRERVPMFWPRSPRQQEGDKKS